MYLMGSNPTPIIEIILLLVLYQILTIEISWKNHKHIDLGYKINGKMPHNPTNYWSKFITINYWDGENLLIAASSVIASTTFRDDINDLFPIIKGILFSRLWLLKQQVNFLKLYVRLNLNLKLINYSLRGNCMNQTVQIEKITL